MHNNILNQSKLTLDQVRILNKINLKNKKKIENLLDNFYKKVNKKHNWILSPIMSRDRVQCKLFSDLNFLELVDFYVKNKKINKLIVENYFLKKIIKRKFQKLKIETSGGFKNIIFDVIIVFKSFMKVLLCSILMISAKDSARKKKFKDKKITLIETFFFNNLFKNNHLHERYHQGVYRKLPEKIKNNCYFFPINLSVFSIKKFTRIVKTSNLKFIHPLDFLKFDDYIKSIFFNSYLKTPKKNTIKYRNFEINEILNYYKFLSNFNFSSYIANINFFFLKRLKESNIKIDLIIDWYENQLIDKGLSLGKNTFYPNSKLKGHIGFLNDFKNIHYYLPTKLEKSASAVPDELLLISHKIKNTVFKNIRFVKKKIVPAIRNKNIFNVNLKNKRNKHQSKNILVVLSSNYEETKFVKNILDNVLNNNGIENFNFIIKPHVNTPLTLFENIKKLKISNKSFYDLLSEVEIVVSGGTTATIEAAIMNKKIILIGNTKGITLNPLIIRSVNKVEICYSSNQFFKCLKKLSQIKNKNMINHKLMNLYFTKFNKRYFKNFYN